MQNGSKQHNDELDDALEDSFPASDPVSMTQPQARHGAPKQHSRHAAQSIKDTANTFRREAEEKIGRRIRPDYLWLGGAFIAGALFGIAARSAPSAFARKGYGARLLDTGGNLQRRVADRVSDLHLQKNLQRKLTQLIDRLQD